ncbi:MAG: acetone carboxylase, gamma subunit [Solirubrobacteraceae bacterium]|nr:acetone carboxylase, gamma subunit [Solirubrobacteraceae bacterium]
MTYNDKQIRDLLDGALSWQQLHQVMSSYKDAGRFEVYVQILQERVGWTEKILLPLTDHLYIVESHNHAVVKCHCGHELGDYRENWKLSALIRVRRTAEDLAEIYGPFTCDPEWMELREFLCPGCGALLEVDAAVPGYPITFDFVPDLATFYGEWLKQPVPAWLEGETQAQRT